MRFFFVCIMAGFLLHTKAFSDIVTIGTLPYAPPFEMIADKQGHMVGFEIDLMTEICKRIKETCIYKPLTFKEIFAEIQSGKIDLGLAAVAITSERQLLYLFSLPYLEAKGQLLTTGDSNVQGIKDLAGRRVGVEAGTLFKSIGEAKLKNSTVVEYPTQQDMYQAVANKQVDALFFDMASAHYWVDNNQGLFKTVGRDQIIGKGYAIIANLRSTALVNRINNALVGMENDGTYLSIFKRYFGQ